MNDADIKVGDIVFDTYTNKSGVIIRVLYADCYKVEHFRGGSTVMHIDYLRPLGQEL